MHGNEIVQYFQNCKSHESGKGHSRKPLYSSTSHIQIENTKTIRLLFKGSWILLYFWHSNWHYFGYISGKVAKPHFLESPQKSLKTRQHHINRATHYEITAQKNEKSVFFWWLLFQKILLTFAIFDESNIWAKVYQFEKMRCSVQLLLKLRAVEFTTWLHWISSRST